MGEGRAEVELAGRYRLERILGSGGSGEVWKAVDGLYDRPVAIKFLKPEVVATKVLLRKFQQEARIGAVVGHPGIVRVDDFGEYDGRWYLVMEFLGGRTLQEEIADHPRGLPLPRLLSLGSQISDALSAAHARGIVHRDLKPANIMLTGPEQAPKICDFGIAHLAEAATINTLTGKTVGTPVYMAPEQWLGKPVDSRTDLYALGGILYTLLTGTPAFKGSLLALKAQHLDTSPPPPHTVRSGLPIGLESLILELLAKDPDDRPPSATDIIECLLKLTQSTTRIQRPRIRTVQTSAPEAAPVSGASTRSVPTKKSAVKAPREAIQARGGLAEAESATYLPDLASSLHSLGFRLARVRDNQAAVDATREAVQIRRGLVESDPSYLPDFSSSLRNLGLYLERVGDRLAAVEALGEAVRVRRGLAEADPVAYLPKFADVLDDLGGCLSEVGDSDAAVEATREAVQVRRKLAELNRHPPDHTSKSLLADGLMGCVSSCGRGRGFW